MRTFDLAPLYRNTVGFDRVAALLDRAMSAETGTQTYPPYNIEKTGDDTYRITIAAAGFSESDLTVESREGQLVITGKKAPRSEEDAARILHRGIAERGFERRFHLADHVTISAAKLENGLLHVDLVREVPEALKPRTIQIATSSPSATIEADAS